MEDYLPVETPEVVSVASSFTPFTLAVGSLVVAALLIALFFFFNGKRSKSRGNTLLLLGPSDGGKTSLLSSLAYGQSLPTHTSIQPNTAILSLSDPKKRIRVLDVPGHPRIRDQYVEHLDTAKAVAFVVDASTVSRNGATVAEHLHHVLHTLTSLPPSTTPPSLLIIANKTDLLKSGTGAENTSTALAVNRVKTVLERELERRRVAQSGGVGVESLGGEGERSELGGLECSGPAGSTFRFADWEGREVSFVGTSTKLGQKVGEKGAEEKPESALGEQDGLFAFREWLDEQFR